MIAAAAGLLTFFGGGGGEDGGPDASRLPPRLLAGERIIAGFDGPSPPRGLKRMIREGEIAGVILFAENVRSRDGVRRMIRSLQGFAGLGWSAIRCW